MSDQVVSRAGWRLLTGELGRRQREVAFLAFWSALESLPTLLYGLAVAAALDQGFLAGRPQVGLAWLGVLGLAMVLQSLATRNTFPWLARIVEPIRDALVRLVVEGALRQAVDGGEHADGAVVARLGQQAEDVRNLIGALLQTLRPTLASLVLALVGLFALSPIVAGIVAPLVLLSLVLFAWLTRSLAARQREAILAGERVTQLSTDIFDGLRDVVAAGAMGTARDTADQALLAEAHAQLRLARTSSLRIPIMALGAGVPIVLILVLAPWLLRPGVLTPGELVGAATYLVSTLEPALRSLTENIASWGRQLGVLLHRIAETSTPPTAEIPRRDIQPVSYDLTTTGLIFAYGPMAEPVIDKLDLHIPVGLHLAIVGPSGTGKSTLATLLAGLATPQSGTARLGGVPVTHVRHSDIALIPQEAYVFSGSLHENLTYLQPETTRAELDRAVRALGMGELVKRIGGYSARLGVGGPELSAGERQRISIARVYLSPAKVIILDEATCHLDPAAEAQAELALAATGRTLIVIAHRISSAHRADQVLLLDGTATQLGSHGYLMAKSVRYADLSGNWDRQAPVHRPSATGWSPVLPSTSPRIVSTWPVYRG